MSIASAAREWNLAQAKARNAQEERDDRARQLREIEGIIDQVEARNLQEQGAVTTSLFDEIACLAPRVAAPVPAAVWRARTAERLHDALLRWQGTLLDMHCGNRLDYADRFD